MTWASETESTSLERKTSRGFVFQGRQWNFSLYFWWNSHAISLFKLYFGSKIAYKIFWRSLLSWKYYKYKEMMKWREISCNTKPQFPLYDSSHDVTDWVAEGTKKICCCGGWSSGDACLNIVPKVEVYNLWKITLFISYHTSHLLYLFTRKLL